MSKVNKIIKYELEGEVDPLLDNGVALYKIATIIKGNHPDIVDIQNLSNMAIMRYRDDKERRHMEEIIENGDDPEDSFLREFRDSIRKLMNINKKWDDRIEGLWQDHKDDATILENLKTIKEARDNRAQSIKEWTTLAQYGTRQNKNVYNINLKKEQNIKLLLLNWSEEVTKNLCSECKARSKEKILELLKEQEEK